MGFNNNFDNNAPKMYQQQLPQSQPMMSNLNFGATNQDVWVLSIVLTLLFLAP